MKTSNGRRIALTTLLLGAAVIAGAGAASKDLVLERWWMWKLDSKDSSVRLKAAERLGAMGSRRSIPKLVDLLKGCNVQEQVKTHGSSINAPDFVGRILEGLGPPAIPALDSALQSSKGERTYWRRSACRALGRIGTRGAVAPLVSCLDDRFECVQMQGFYALGELGAVANDAIPAISRHLQDPKANPRSWAESALNKIRPAGAR